MTASCSVARRHGARRWPVWGAVLSAALAVAPLSLGLSAAVQAQSTLPALGDAAAADLTVGAERRLGDRIMREIRRDPDWLDDPLLQDYLNSLWQPLLVAARARGDLSDDQQTHFALQAFLVRDRSINAFALPGGYVGVHLGLIALTSSRDELAAVLAHELSHITQRHIARNMASSRRQSMLSVASMIVGILAASRSQNVDAANAVIVGGQAAAVQGQLNFSRDMEREADRVGFGVLDAAGFAPDGMASMFDQMQFASRLNDSGQFPYLRTHPLTSERIAEARGRLGTGADRKAAAASAQWLHAAMQGRARAWMDGRTQTLTRLSGGGVPTAAAAAQTPQALATACAAAIAATRLKDWRVADAALARARALATPQGEAVLRAVQVLQVESLLERGQAVEAARVLSIGVLDGSRAGLLLGARLAALPGSEAALVSRTREELQTWVVLHADDAGAWLALAQVNERLGVPLAALRAHAEARFAQGDLSGAVDRLRAGQRLARSSGAVESMEGVIIESRLKVIEQQRRVEMEQERNGSQN
ncbi:M48 family metalloprotease [Sphaerotilus sp.]|uniref:M48 family metalloprotease n=1 Tax=Sphaerotilus sp. TaxID=2093942 RepID=UPI002ACDB492|nr:M48 family metalloprotease [Sphaerotilus sp.]MDZ7855115.1 M48 family metalloprotease [Sphaerotilus sp.]